MFSSGLVPGGNNLMLLLKACQQAFWFDEACFVGELFNMLQLSFEREDDYHNGLIEQNQAEVIRTDY